MQEQNHIISAQIFIYLGFMIISDETRYKKLNSSCQRQLQQIKTFNEKQNTGMNTKIAVLGQQSC